MIAGHNRDERIHSVNIIKTFDVDYQQKQSQKQTNSC